LLGLDDPFAVPFVNDEERAAACCCAIAESPNLYIPIPISYFSQFCFRLWHLLFVGKLDEWQGGSADV
jgi:hypothetical protein